VSTNKKITVLQRKKRIPYPPPQKKSKNDDCDDFCIPHFHERGGTKKATLLSIVFFDFISCSIDITTTSIGGRICGTWQHGPTDGAKFGKEVIVKNFGI
jgi:hypothetical protein